MTRRAVRTRFLADENISNAVVNGLRVRGHDVLSAREGMRRSDDAVILRRAQRERRVVLTHDKDFADLAFRHRQSARSGVILFRLTGAKQESDDRRILEVLDQSLVWSGHFTTVTGDRIRMRALAARVRRSS